ncbi:MAG: RecX family transcriptional regulator [Emcibacteraceae bacterium]|nr:RecX family transcriptional regulator [Emcibacteraceae bacterium]
MKKFKIRKNITRSYLQGAAYRYLERYATTETNLIFILKRKAEKIITSLENQDGMREEADGWINDIVSDCVKHGLVNDKLYAESRVRSFLSAGNSSVIIKNKLRAKGVSSEIISVVMKDAYKAQPNLNVVSAIKYAKKRRFGPFRVKDNDEKTDLKETSAMARAGFSYDEVNCVLKAERKELEDILYG